MDMIAEPPAELQPDMRPEDCAICASALFAPSASASDKAWENMHRLAPT